ncbi:MAG: hydrogenase maturation nickel metallochaperone HypA [bacterium]|nr:hydrogenase maturation nickel metallochaperone HypA [bacterium]
MHDLVAAQDIVKTACEIAKKNKLNKISKITIKLGKIIEHNEELQPENLQFNFELVKRNTLAEKAKLVILKGKGRELNIVEVEGDK